MTGVPVFRLKAACAAVGLATGIAGIALDRRALIWCAVSLLAVAFLLRFVDKRRSRPDP